ncbi:hypothetical protein Cadr_000023683 [Camelus dromedarius]|uniref:Uncharacterized protein n=1 Tax=Camelus dromedarius TaxID=9838 RepID=A0A5N4CY15_CAMDR|nr:hypothetical protein Cadr_000023683 [Camelus dromedarius]
MPDHDIRAPKYPPPPPTATATPPPPTTITREITTPADTAPPHLITTLLPTPSTTGTTVTATATLRTTPTPASPTEYSGITPPTATPREAQAHLHSILCQYRHLHRHANHTNSHPLGPRLTDHPDRLSSSKSPSPHESWPPPDTVFIPSSPTVHTTAATLSALTDLGHDARHDIRAPK